MLPLLSSSRLFLASLALLVAAAMVGCSAPQNAAGQPTAAVAPASVGEAAASPAPASAPPASASPTPEPTAQPALVSPLPAPTITSAPVAADPSPQVDLVLPNASSAPTATLPVDSYQVVASYPHDPEAFTQGLVYADGIFYEGTGLRGRSSLRKVDPTSGQVTQRIDLPEQLFGEGIAILGDRLYQLSWQENTGFIYDKDSFELLDTWTYPTEGWGLATDGQRLIMSDGTEVLHFLDPDTLAETGSVAVSDAAGNPVVRLNELEFVEGEVWANIWQTDRIARIDPATGDVLGWIDLRGLLPAELRTQPVDVLNGIAYDAATDRVFVTGKLWPRIFEIDVVEPGP